MVNTWRKTNQIWQRNKAVTSVSKTKLDRKFSIHGACVSVCVTLLSVLPCKSDKRPSFSNRS